MEEGFWFRRVCRGRHPSDRGDAVALVRPPDVHDPLLGLIESGVYTFGKAAEGVEQMVGEQFNVPFGATEESARATTSSGKTAGMPSRASRD